MFVCTQANGEAPTRPSPTSSHKRTTPPSPLGHVTGVVGTATSVSDALPPVNKRDWKAKLAGRPEFILVWNLTDVVMAVDAAMVFANRTYGTLLSGMQHYVIVLSY
jgi:hypothetical protein